jgi:hypothetical protein
VENAFGTLQDRLIKEMRLAGVGTLAAANDYFQQVFVPFWEQRFARPARQAADAHRQVDREVRLDSVLSVRAMRTVARDYTITWEGELWGVAREQVRPGLRNARVQLERRLDGSRWLCFRGQFVPLRRCGPPRSATARTSGLRPSPWHRLVRRSPIPSLLSPAKADISKLPKTGHFYFALTDTQRRSKSITDDRRAPRQSFRAYLEASAPAPMPDGLARVSRYSIASEGMQSVSSKS